MLDFDFSNWRTVAAANAKFPAYYSLLEGLSLESGRILLGIKLGGDIDECHSRKFSDFFYDD